MGVSGDFNPSSISLIAAVGAAYAVLLVLRKFLPQSQANLDAIPSVGVPRGPFGFYIGAWNVLKNGITVAEEGVRKYPGKPYKIPLGTQWLVVVNGRALIEDIRKAPTSALSSSEGVNALLHIEHSLGHDQFHDPYHIHVIRSTLTRNLGVRFPDLRDEVVVAFNDLLPGKTDEWIAVPALQTVLPIVSRISNRLLIGLKCRDPDYINLTTSLVDSTINDAAWLTITPSFLRPLAFRVFGHLEAAVRGAEKVLGPMIEHRLDMDDKYGADWPDDERPNDLISWLLDEARGHPKRRTVRNLLLCCLNGAFGAIHTTTQAALHALYTLCAHLECIEELREEVESIVRVDGWTKDSLAKMVKLDSFLKESSRFMPGAAVNLMRVAVNDFTFSDGTTVPAGTLIGVHLLAEHHSEANYHDPDVVDPFRFSRMRANDAEGSKHQMVSPSHDFLSFGIGRHACPGRFFGVNELKLIMAHILVTYDVKLPGEQKVRPKDEVIAISFAANSTAEVMFRRRR